MSAGSLDTKSVMYKTPPLTSSGHENNMTNEIRTLPCSGSSNALLPLRLQLFQQVLRGTLPIPLWVIRGPPPQVLAGVFECPLCPPTQFPIRPFRIRRQIQHIPRPPPHNLILQLLAYSRAESLDHLKHGAPLSRTEVPGARARVVFAEVVECDKVAAGEVEDVDIVTDGGAVFGGVVCGQFCEHACAIGPSRLGIRGEERNCGPTVAEYEQLVSLADGNLREQGEEVIGHALRVFAHDAARVRAGRVKVAQEGGVPVVAGFGGFFCEEALRVDMVGNEVFDGGFGAAVGVCRADGAVFGDGDHVGEAGCVAVDGGGGGEDDIGDIILGHGGEEVDGTVDIGAPVFEGNFAGFSYCLSSVSVAFKICHKASEK